MFELVERPDELTWDSRRDWLAAREEALSKEGVSGRLSEQATALMVELERAFCAGAWAAVIVLAGAIVDAQAFHAGFPADLEREERDWLRRQRNALLHENRQHPAITLEDLWLREPEWAKAAKRAANLALVLLYKGAGK